MTILLVGGAVRDKLLGLKPKDLDYVFVLDKLDVSVEEGFSIMEKYLIDEGFTIWLSTPDMYTIRAKFPPNHKFSGDADFVLARREVGYEYNSRKPKLVIGTLWDDLVRRDFTINAMAEDEDGSIYDPFGGKKDLERRILRTPVDANITLLDDPLRLLRAIRFKITKNLIISSELSDAMKNPKVMEKMIKVVSKERIREELYKMFKYDTISTLETLQIVEHKFCGGLLDLCFGKDGMWLKPTFEK